MLRWFLLAGNEPEELKKVFNDFYFHHKLPVNVALWKWKKTCWICSPESYKQEILSIFARYGVVEFSSAPSPNDIEFMSGDKLSLGVSKK